MSRLGLPNVRLLEFPRKTQYFSAPLVQSPRICPRAAHKQILKPQLEMLRSANTNATDPGSISLLWEPLGFQGFGGFRTLEVRKLSTPGLRKSSLLFAPYLRGAWGGGVTFDRLSLFGYTVPFFVVPISGIAACTSGKLVGFRGRLKWHLMQPRPESEFRASLGVFLRGEGVQGRIRDPRCIIP